MRVNYYGELSQIVADLAHLDKKIQSKRYRVILEQLDAFPFNESAEIQVLEFLKKLREDLREIAQTENARQTPRTMFTNPTDAEGGGDDEKA